MPCVLRRRAWFHYANEFITKEVLKQAKSDDEKSQTHGMFWSSIIHINESND